MKIRRFTILALVVFLFSSLAFTNEVHAQYEENAHFSAGIMAAEMNNMPLAFTEFLAAANEGHADSQFNVGLMYEQGIGVEKDAAKAIYWYGKSAAQGNSNAQYNLAVLYENGIGTTIDYAKANSWYREASAQGDALAIGNLGMLYIRGDGVNKNLIAGVALLIWSATLDGSPENLAKQNLASTRGLTPEMATEAQALTAKLSSAKDFQVPLDAFLKK
jgi:TPR repeat protein